MADQLKSILTFSNVAVNATSTQPHLLSISGRGVIPDELVFESPNFTLVACDATNVTVRNEGTETATLHVLAKYDHTILRAYGAEGTTALSIQPFVGNLLGNANYARNVDMPEIPDLTYPYTPTETVIYVRLGGSDTTGDGSAASPYATIQRALADVPKVIMPDVCYTIDCSGLGTVNLAHDIFVEGYDGKAYIWANATAPSWRYYNAALNIRATPTVLDTVTAAQVVAQNADATTDLISIQTTKVWGVNAYQGCFLVDGTGGTQYAAIASNTANTLEVCTAYALTPPLQIVTPSTELVGASFCPLSFIGVACSVGVQGLKLTPPAPWGQGLRFEYCKRAMAMNTHMAGLTAYLGNQITLYGCVIDGAGAVESEFKAPTVYTRGCYFEGAKFAERSSHACVVGYHFREFVADACDPLGPSVGWDDTAAGTMSIYRAQIRNALSDGVQYRGGNRGQVKNTDIDSSVNDAILAEYPGILRLIQVEGAANAGLGVRIENGAQVQRVSGSPTGVGGDFKCGGNAANTWVAFAGAGSDENDLAAGTPQICRIFT